MKNFIALNVVLAMSVFLTGCVQQQTIPTQPATNQPVANQPTSTDELSRYGEKTERARSLIDPIVFNGPEVGSGELVNDDENKSMDKWYFVRQGGKTKNVATKERYSLIIDEQCLIHAVGFRNGYCLKYLALDENKNVLYDGYHGPSVMIYGEVLSDKSIHVSDILLQQ